LKTFVEEQQEMKRPFVYAVVCGLSLLAPLGCTEETKKESKTTTSTPGGTTTSTTTEKVDSKGKNPPPADKP
jgi:hypothetical protein